MSARVKEIVEQIVQSVVSLDDIDRIERKLSLHFRKKGYKFQEIKQAFTFIFRLLEAAGERPNAPVERPVRMLSQDESIKLTDGARSLIFRLYYCAEIESDDLERILGTVAAQDRVMSETDITDMLGVSIRGAGDVEH
jgi:hypothetical protein